MYRLPLYGHVGAVYTQVRRSVYVLAAAAGGGTDREWDYVTHQLEQPR